MLSSDFGSLFRFIDALDSQVAGRQSNRPPAEMEAQLLRLVRGESLSATERLVIFDELKKQPGWIAWLADQVKASRPDAPSKQQGTTSG